MRILMYHSLCVEDNFVGVDSFPLSYGSWGLNPGHRFWWQAPFSIEPSFLPPVMYSEYFPGCLAGNIEIKTISWHEPTVPPDLGQP